MPDAAAAPLKCHPAYAEFCCELEQIERHKWLASEAQGRDVGFEAALMEWVQRHRDAWRQGVRASKGGVA